MRQQKRDERGASAVEFAFIVPLKHAGLALAIGLGACLNAALLYRTLRQQEIFKPQPGWPIFILKVAAAVTVSDGASGQLAPTNAPRSASSVSTDSVRESAPPLGTAYSRTAVCW